MKALQFIFKVMTVMLTGILSAQGGTKMPTTGTPYLPPLLRFEDGTSVKTRQDMEKCRAELRRLVCETFIGTPPDTVPRLLRSEVVRQRRAEDSSLRKTVRLTFGTRNKAAFDIEVWIPKGDGPFPVFLTVPYAWWADKGLSRGYLVCIYPGADGQDSSDLLLKEYPKSTWSRLHRRAWLGSRALDYVLTLPEADQERVCTTGHSRNGKQALIAASFDERIKAVVSSSSGTPGGVPYRFASRQAFLESPAGWPNNWFVDSLKTYVGREHQLPTDGHAWFGLIAPRPCLISTAHNDGCESTFAVERAYLEGREVYRLLGKPDALRIRWRPGQHHGTVAQDKAMVDGYFDWFDLWFGRGDFSIADFPETFLHRFDWQAWRKGLSKKDASPPPMSEGVKVRIQWALGQPPEKIEWNGEYSFLTAAESNMMTHDRWAVPDTARIPVSFGENVRGNLYYNARKRTPAPVVIWLHPYSYNSGYNEGYGPGYPGERTDVYHRLAEAGYVVLCFDQCGFGLRLLEGRDFYGQYPKWSRLGRMVHDVRSAVDFLVEGRGRSRRKMPAIRKDKVFVLGYALGGMVGLYAAALDDRIAGVATFSGFTPLRTNTDERPTGGNRRWWELHALQPQLGLFHGREDEIPYDFDEVLSLVAPRPCLVVAPKRDRFAEHEEVVACVHRAKAAWNEAGKIENLTLVATDDISRFQTAQQDRFLKWVTEAVQATTPRRK
jgi:pimeloyl-ACP methyl ester carboxylesterase